MTIGIGLPLQIPCYADAGGPSFVRRLRTVG
jgi:hypothetical protein